MDVKRLRTTSLHNSDLPFLVKDVFLSSYYHTLVDLAVKMWTWHTSGRENILQKQQNISLKGKAYWITLYTQMSVNIWKKITCTCSVSWKKVSLVKSANNSKFSPSWWPDDHGSLISLFSSCRHALLNMTGTHCCILGWLKQEWTGFSLHFLHMSSLLQMHYSHAHRILYSRPDLYLQTLTG